MRRLFALPLLALPLLALALLTPRPAQAQFGNLSAATIFQATCGAMKPAAFQVVTAGQPFRFPMTFTVPDSTGRPARLAVQWAAVFRTATIDSGGLFLAKQPGYNLVLVRAPTPDGGWMVQAKCVRVVVR